MEVEKPLISILQKLSQKEDTAFYAPGHKRGQGIPSSLRELLGTKVFTADLPELPELDNLFAPIGVIQEAQKLAAKTFGAQETWFLVNGSTCGVIAAILATCSPGNKIILPRNSHQSAISGLILSGAMPIFLNPDYDTQWDLSYSITPAALKSALKEHPDTQAVFITYPTYQGVTGHLKEIVQITHNKGIPLIVDEAHGSHFTFHPDLPPSALSLEADLVVQSIHKVLSSLTQSSMLHLRGERVAPQKVSRALQLIQSTSPSYLLLASLDAARAQMAEEGKTLLSRTLNLAQMARTSLKEITGISILEKQTDREGFVDLDITRLTVKVTDIGLTGFEVDRWLREEAQLTAELPNLRHLTFMMTIGNTLEDIQKLTQAFRRLVSERGGNKLPVKKSPSLPLFEANSSVISPREAFFSPTETVTIDCCLGRISAELICPYPPGVPLIMPGEKITPSHLKYLKAVLEQQGTITGCSDPTLNTFKVIN